MTEYQIIKINRDRSSHVPNKREYENYYHISIYFCPPSLSISLHIVSSTHFPHSISLPPALPLCSLLSLQRLRHTLHGSSLAVSAIQRCIGVCPLPAVCPCWRTFWLLKRVGFLGFTVWRHCEGLRWTIRVWMGEDDDE